MSEQMDARESEIELLLEIADMCCNKRLSGTKTSNGEGLQPKLSQLLKSPLFAGYNFDEKDVKVIAVMLSHYFKNDEEDEDEDEEIKTREVLKILEKDTKAIFREFKRIVKLHEMGVLEIEQHRNPFVRRFMGNAEESDEDKVGGIGLIRSSVRLSDKFLDSIFGIGEKARRGTAEHHSGKTAHETSEPYKDNLEYLVDQFEKLKILRRDNDEPFMPFQHRVRRLRRNTGRLEYNRRQEEKELKILEERISLRLAGSDTIFPFEAFKKKKGLNKKEELIIIAMLENDVMNNDDCEIDEMLDMISKTTYERLMDKKLFGEEGRLVREKIIEICPQRRFLNETHIVKLNDRLKARLLEEKKGRKTKLQHKEDDFFEIIKPSVTLDKIILHPKTHEEINLSVGIIRRNTSNILKEWGIKGSNLIQSAEKNSSPVTMLFHGAPGTGKTLTAHAIACTLKRKLITLDCSKILNAWVGESEKNTRKIFDRYREIAESMKNSPVLLLNEADQFFHKRIQATRAVDHMYNQMQNIFLEQLEKFDGILIATTNLVDNLDSAFSRRFHYKINFRRPGAEERQKLWHVHIPAKAPLAEDTDIQYLAEHYDLSGAQIGVVIHNAATRAARRGDKICQEDFIQACEDEVSGNFDEKAKEKVGF